GAQPVVGGDSSNCKGVAINVARRALELGFELGLDLEQLAELRVVGGQQVIEVLVAEQDDLGIERDGVGIEGDGGERAEVLGCRLYPDALAAERTLEGIPGEWLGQQLAHVEHQVAAVRS